MNESLLLPTYQNPHIPMKMRVLLYIAHKTYGYDKTKDLIPLSQFESALGISRSHVRYHLKNLQQDGLVIGHYTCMACGSRFTGWGKCPCCGKNHYKEIWHEWELSPEGKKIVSHKGESSIYKEEDVSLSLDAQAFFDMTLRTLCICKVEVIHKFKGYLLKWWNSHSYTDWLLALAICHNGRERKKAFGIEKPVESLGSLFDWSFQALEKNREESKIEGQTFKPTEAEHTCRERLSFALDMMDKLPKLTMEQREIQHLYCLEIVDHLYSAYDDYGWLLDELTKARRYIPRLLQKPKQGLKQAWEEDFRRYMTEMRRAVLLA